jgi:mitochondrial fission protein ELM1
MPWQPDAPRHCFANAGSATSPTQRFIPRFFVFMPSVASAVPIWVLLGTRHGDNQQLLAAAQALELPYRAIPLHFNAAAGLPPVLLGARRLSWRSEAPLAPPWPRVVLAAGRKSVPAAMWIRRRSAGRARLVHFNRPWAPLSWFDLIVTTPQYALPERPNVLANLMPFLLPPAPADAPLPMQERAAALPRPWTVALVGGNSRPYVLDDAAAASLAASVNARVRDTGGSVWVLGSPRTPASAMTIIERALDVPSQVVRWGDGENPYGALRRMADRFIVTADSASMLVEALLSGRPVTPFSLPARPDWRWRLASAWRTAAARAPSSMTARSFEAVLDAGLLSSVRDLGLLQRALRDAGMFDGTGRPLELAQRERSATVARIAELIESP